MSFDHLWQENIFIQAIDQQFDALKFCVSKEIHIDKKLSKNSITDYDDDDDAEDSFSDLDNLNVKFCMSLDEELFKGDSSTEMESEGDESRKHSMDKLDKFKFEESINSNSVIRINEQLVIGCNINDEVKLLKSELMNRMRMQVNMNIGIMKQKFAMEMYKMRCYTQMNMAMNINLKNMQKSPDNISTPMSSQQINTNSTKNLN
jgi:hypothetical protein